MKRALCLCLALAATGCAGNASTRSLSRRVDNAVVSVFPEEGRRWTYEAENEVIIALDQLDSARDNRLEARTWLKLVDTALDTSDKRANKGKEVWEARREHAKAELKHAEAEVDAAELNVFCARALLELNKARLAVRFDLPVEDGFVKKFEDQYEGCARDLKDAKTEAEQRAQQAAEAKEKWHQTRADYVKKTGDHNHGLWID
ncbi:MAG: hypothetical protein U1E65_29805 [Myxococcota bacterium]